ncbi:hypothetical protein [Alloactinosynnema sp. L-07]|nr:hypothetical protein [Alloactinosynnema sp. L-07]
MSARAWRSSKVNEAPGLRRKSSTSTTIPVSASPWDGRHELVRGQSGHHTPGVGLGHGDGAA